jgi:hypothetical protein
LAVSITHTLAFSLSLPYPDLLQVVGPGADRLRVTFSPVNGTFTGTFRANPPHPAVTPISGVVYQKTNLGAGVFLGPSQAGNVTLTPQ